MNNQNTLIKEQYNHSGLFEDILERIKNKNGELENITREHFSGVDEFHL